MSNSPDDLTIPVRQFIIVREWSSIGFGLEVRLHSSAVADIPVGIDVREVSFRPQHDDGSICIPADRWKSIGRGQEVILQSYGSTSQGNTFAWIKVRDTPVLCETCKQPIRRIIEDEGYDLREFQWTHESGALLCDMDPPCAQPPEGI